MVKHEVGVLGTAPAAPHTVREGSKVTRACSCTQLGTLPTTWPCAISLALRASPGQLTELL